MMVVQSPEEALAAFAAVVPAGFAADSLAGVLGWVEQTPWIVSTGALAGTEAGFSAAAGGACIFAGFPAGIGLDCGGGGELGVACPHAIVPNKTHTSQLLPITLILQEWSTRKVKKYQAGNPSTKAPLSSMRTDCGGCARGRPMAELRRNTELANMVRSLWATAGSLPIRTAALPRLLVRFRSQQR